MSGLAIIDRTSKLAVRNGADGFDFSDLRVFSHIPEGGFDVVAMCGGVIVFDRQAHHWGPIEVGKLYVRESQHPPGASAYSDWLDREREDARSRGQPFALLKTRREVVQAITHPATGGPAYRLACGFIDGPYKEWCYSYDIVGKVVGVYRPDLAE